MSLKSKIETGKSIELDLSFLKEEYNKILSVYLSRKARKIFLRKQLKLRNEMLTELKRLGNKGEQVKKIEEEMVILKSKFETAKYLHFSLKERGIIFRSMKKIKQNIAVVEKEGSTIAELKEILGFLKL